MPAAAAAAFAWVGNAIATAFWWPVAVLSGLPVLPGSLAFQLVSAVSQVALAYAIDQALRPTIKPMGQELQLQIDPDYPREMIIGERAVAGSLIARYSRGSNLYNAHFVIQVADHPCTSLEKVYGDGRIVRDTALTHGTRTEITAYSYSGGARVWMTWHDGRPGQTADSNLVTNAALDPDVVAGTIDGWTNDHVGAGCAYVHVEVQYDGDILTSIPQFLFLVKGAPLYDRRLDDTAGGTGDHRHDDPDTWEYSTNAAVATDHFLLGYQVEDEVLAFGLGLRKSEVPYDVFEHLADLCDEDVETGTGGDVETIKRFAANGMISSADFFEDVLETLQVQMAARIIDLGGRIGILGAEERTPVVDLTDDDLISDEAIQFADKLPFTDLIGAVSGAFSDPGNLYQPTPYERQEGAYFQLPDGGEAAVRQLDLPMEIHPRRAVRLASAFLARESLQPRLIATFTPKAWALEAGDWFTFTSDRLQIAESDFEVIDIVKNDDFTVSLTARAIDPDFLAFDNDNDPDLSVPPEVDPMDLLLDEPAGTITAISISNGGATEPAIRFTLTSNPAPTREIVIEVQQWNGAALTGDPMITTMHSDETTKLVRAGILPAAQYKARIKARIGARESPWTSWSSAITASSTFATPTSGTASAIVGQGALATLNQVNLGASGKVYREDTSTHVTDAAAITALGTAAAIAAQGALATLSTVAAAQLAAGTGTNCIVDGDFRQGTTFWGHFADTGSIASYSQAESNAVRYRQLNGTGVTVGSYIGMDCGPAPMPCLAGDRIECSAYIGRDNTSNIQLIAHYINSSGSVFDTTTVAQSNIGNDGAGALATYGRLGGFVTAPANTARVYFSIRAIAASATLLLRVAKPYLGRASSAQTELTAWNPGFLAIDTPMLTANSVTDTASNSDAAESITTGQFDLAVTVTVPDAQTKVKIDWCLGYSGPNFSTGSANSLTAICSLTGVGTIEDYGVLDQVDVASNRIYGNAAGFTIHTPGSAGSKEYKISFLRGGSGNGQWDLTRIKIFATLLKR